MLLREHWHVLISMIESLESVLLTEFFEAVCRISNVHTNNGETFDLNLITKEDEE
jgi:hypothetical protein